MAAATAATSFRKKGGSRIPYIAGTKPSIQNSQLLISTGVPSFDCTIGGGVPIGALVLVEEDAFGSFSKLLLKYFLAEGVVSQHDLLVASKETNPKQLVDEIPAPLVQRNSRDMFYNTNDDKMSIAWRYQNLPSVELAQQDNSFGHNYDITQVIGQEEIQKVNIHLWNGTTEGSSECSYMSLLKFIQNQIKSGQFGLDHTPQKRNVLRIAIQSLASPLWDSNYSKLYFFLYSLKSMLSSAYAVCMVSMPSYLFSELSVIERCQHISDIAVNLDSFSGSERETNPVFKDYHGLFHINKLPAINTLACHTPESFDLAFKLRRKKFSIEILHLPPELQETTEREQDDFSTSQFSCGSVQKKIIDF